MSLKRFVYLVTSSPHKVKELQRSFSRYGINVLHWQKNSSDDDMSTVLEEAELRRLLKGESIDRSELGIRPTDRVSIVAVIRENTKLRKHNTTELLEEKDFEQLERVQHISELKAVRMMKKTQELRTHDYTFTTDGYLDLDRQNNAANSAGEVFGWDEKFVVRGTNNSYQDLVSKGVKVSSRDMNVSRLIRDILYYKRRTNLKWSPISQERSIEFGTSVRQFVETNEYLNNPVAQKYRIPKMYTAMCNNGAFFRAAKNRREKTYWLPGLNAGVPFTAKRDAIHEITYMTHDFGHFTVPDLVFEGRLSPMHRNVYIAWRMLSEAVTMIMADMIFVHSLKLTSPEYDYTKRRIFPLLQDTGIDLSQESKFIENCERLLRANAQYCVLGADDKYRELLLENGVTDTNNLDLYKEKYMPFFVEDFRWTVKNYSGMELNAKEHEKWWNMVHPVRDHFGLNLSTVSEAIEFCPGLSGKKAEDVSREEIVWEVFDLVLESCLKPGWLSPDKVEMLPEEVQLSKAFARWFIGQAAIFAKYDFVPESKMYFDKMMSSILSLESGVGISVEQVIFFTNT